MAEEFSLLSLPLGYRFRPTDEELVDFYLRLKINGHDNEVRVIREIDVCKWEPWELPGLSIIKTKDREWFFFCPLDRKYPNGHRLNRATERGYWKATGKDRKVKSRTNLIGMKKTLVFYAGRAPKGKRTNWVMHEYRATEEDLDGTKPGQNPFVLCRLFKKQDGRIEDLNSDDTEVIGSSPITVQSSPEVAQSELESSQRSPLNGTLSDTGAPAECQGDSCYANEAGDQTMDTWTYEEDQQLKDALDSFYLPPPEPLDDKLFSPLHSQVQVEMGHCIYDHISNGFGYSHSMVQFHDDSNDLDGYIPEFLDSIFKPDDCPYDESFTQKSINRKPPIHIETTSILDSNVHEYQEIGDVLQIGSRETHYSESISTGEQFNCLDASNDVNQSSSGNVVEAVIKIRARNAPNRQNTWKSNTQGNASRRIRLQVQSRQFSKNTRYFLSEEKGGNATENNTAVDEQQKSSLFEVSECSELSEEELAFNSGPIMRCRNNDPVLKKVPLVFSKASRAPRSVWRTVMFRISILAVLFLIFASTWRCVVLETN